MNFIQKNFIQKGNRLAHNNETKKGFLDDYAHTIDALVNLYQVSFDEKWLYQAQKLGEYTLKNFKNQETGMFQYSNQTSSIASVEKVLLIDVEDNFLPSSNSIMAQGLFVLGQYFENSTHKIDGTTRHKGFDSQIVINMLNQVSLFFVTKK